MNWLTALNFAMQQAPRVAQVAQPAIKPIQRGISTLQNYLSPYGQMAVKSLQESPKWRGAMSLWGLKDLADYFKPKPVEAAEADEGMPPSNWMDELIEEEEELKKKKKKKKEKKKKKADDKKEKKQELKKGGYVKKRRKRKHYRASGFVKMKKKKKYIT